jgi:hypothetical protein
MPFLKPSPLSAVTEAPSVPCSSTIFGLPVRGLRQPLGRPLALPDEVRAHKRDVLLADLGVRLAVHEEDGHVGLPGGLERGRHPLLLARRDEEQVHALGYHVLDVGDLLGRRGLGVGHD